MLLLFQDNQLLLLFQANKLLLLFQANKLLLLFQDNSIKKKETKVGEGHRGLNKPGW